MGQAKRRAERAQAMQAAVSATIGTYETTLAHAFDALPADPPVARIVVLSAILAEALRRAPWDHAPTVGLALSLPRRASPRPAPLALLPDVDLHIEADEFAVACADQERLARVVGSIARTLTEAAKDASARTDPAERPWRDLIETLVAVAGQHAPAVAALAVSMVWDGPDGGFVAPHARVDGGEVQLLLRRRDGAVLAAPATPDRRGLLRARIHAIAACGTRPPPAYRRFEQRLAKNITNTPMDMRVSVLGMLVARVVGDAFGDEAEDVLATFAEMHPRSDETGPSPLFDPGEMYDFVQDDIPPEIQHDLRNYIHDLVLARREEFGALAPEVRHADDIHDDAGARLCALSWILDAAGYGRTALVIEEAERHLGRLRRGTSGPDALSVEVVRRDTALDDAWIDGLVAAMEGIS